MVGNKIKSILKKMTREKQSSELNKISLRKRQKMLLLNKGIL